MPSRGFYTVTRSEEGKAVQRDQSYRNCVISLLIFFILCIFLIMAGWLLNTSHNDNQAVGRYYNNPSTTVSTKAAATTTVVTPINNTTGEPVIVNSTDSAVANTEETSTSAFNETKAIFTETVTPKTEETASETPHRSSVTTDHHGTSIKGSAEEIQPTVPSHFVNESTTFRNESSDENRPIKVEDGTNGDVQKEFQSTTQKIQNTEAVATVQSSAVTKTPMEVIFISTNSTDTKEAYKSALNVTPSTYPENVTSSTEKVISETTENSEENRLKEMEGWTNEDVQKQLQTTTQKVQNSEVTVQTLITPTTQVIIDSKNSTLAETDEASKSALNETQSTLSRTVAPKTEETVPETPSVTSGYSTNLIAMFKSSTPTPAVYSNNETTAFGNESSGESTVINIGNRMGVDEEEQFQTTAQTIKNTEATATVQTSAIPKTQEQVIIDSANSNSSDTEEASKSPLNETQSTFPETVTPRAQKVVPETNETYSTTTGYSTSLTAGIKNFNKETTAFGNESSGESTLINIGNRMGVDEEEHFQTTAQTIKNAEATATVQTSAIPKTQEQVIIDSANSNFSDTEEASKSPLNETQSTFPETVTPRAEKAIPETNETYSTTTGYSTSLTAGIKNSASDSSAESKLINVEERTSVDAQEQFQTTTQKTKNTEAAATVQTSTTPAVTQEQVIFHSANSNLSDIEEASKFASNETQLTSSETVTARTEKAVFFEATEGSPTTIGYSTNLIAVNEELTPPTYLSNESTTSKNESSGESKLNNVEDDTNGEAQEKFNTSESTKLLNERLINTTVATNFEKTTKISQHTDEELQSTFGEYASSTAEPIEEETSGFCLTASCKHLASKMLFYMNHSADPCDDFYEYACGGFEADYHIKENDLSVRIYETIRRQAKKHKNHSQYREFNNYYDSCLKYEVNFDIEHRIRLAREALKEIGHFYTTTDWPEGSQGDFTQLFSNMLLNDRPLLFDVVPDVNDAKPDAFILNVGPAVDNKLFQYANIYDQCYSENEESNENVNLDELYKNYENCKNNTKSFVDSLNRTLTKLRIFDGLNNTYNISQNIDTTVINTDLDIIKTILSKFPSESKIRELYRSKNYTVMTVGELQRDQKLLDWTQLIHSLTGLIVGPDMTLHVYCKDQLIMAMKELEQIGRRPRDLNNALLGLYARNLYQDLVAARSSTDLQKHCTHVAVHLMRSEASDLYMSSFNENDIINMETVMREHFDKLKKTMRDDIGHGASQTRWASLEDQEGLIQKLNDIKMYLHRPVINQDAYELTITDNHFVNSMKLMKKYRSMIYSVITKNLRPLDQIWTFFASPFEWTARTIYGLNLIVIPYGAVDWSTVLETERDTYYLNRATIGNLIAREIAHNFDKNGFRIWHRANSMVHGLSPEDDTTKEKYDEYTDCHENSLFADSIEITLPTTEQSVSFKMPSQSLNERLAEAMSMRLARRSLDSVDKQNRLLWLQQLNVDQLFYLAYAQTHCTKAPLTSSYVSLHEDPFLPGRVRLFAVIRNNDLIGKAWQCPMGSRTLSSVTCDDFPYLRGQEIEDDVDPV